MKKKRKLYTRLPGVTYSNFGRYTLWQGPDHLLHMYSNGMNEEYKRFYYQDIQGMVITKTRKAAVTQAFILGFFLLTVWFAWWCWNQDLTPASGFLSVMAGVFLAFLLNLLIKGPSCECRIITAVQNEKLKAVSLLRHGRKLMVKLKPLILDAQGVMDQADLPKALNVLAENRQGAAHTVHSGVHAQPDVPTEKDDGKSRLLHLVVFSSLAAYAVLVTLGLPQRSLALVSGSYLFLFVAGLGATGALTVKGLNRSAALRKMVWAGLIFVLAAFIQSYGEMMILYFVNTANDPGTLMDQGLMFRRYYSLRPLDYRLVTGVDGVKIFMAAAIGIPGLFMGFGKWR